MNFKTLVQKSEVRALAAADLLLPTLPADGNRLLQDVARRFSSDYAVYARQHSFAESIEIQSYPHGSSSWYGDRHIRCLIWMGDLVIDGDLIDDHWEMLPLLIVRGNLTVRNWLRGGMPSFVGGSVRAAGFIVGHYNDSALFVGGDLTASGYIPRAKPYPDLPNIAPHQIAGKLNARQLHGLTASNEELKAAFVDEVLVQDEDEEDVGLDERALLERFNAGLAIWR